MRVYWRKRPSFGFALTSCPVASSHRVELAVITPREKGARPGWRVEIDLQSLAAEGYSYPDTAPAWAYLSGPAACRKWATKHLDRYLQPESLVVADA